MNPRNTYGDSTQKMGIALDLPRDGLLCLFRCDSKAIHNPHAEAFPKVRINHHQELVDRVSVSLVNVLAQAFHRELGPQPLPQLLSPSS